MQPPDAGLGLQDTGLGLQEGPYIGQSDDLRHRLAVMDQAISRLKRQMPARAREHSREGHIHNLLSHITGGLGFGGLVHYDYIVDANYPGVQGATVTGGSGSTSKIYTTLQAAITAADAENRDISILINAGTYTGVTTMASSFSHRLHLVGEGIGKVNLSNDLDINGTGGVWISNIRMTDRLNAGTNVEIHAEDCDFAGAVSGDYLHSTFNNCILAGYDIQAGETPAQVLFANCEFTGISTWGGAASSLIRHYFVNCAFTSTVPLQIGQVTLDEIVFQGCHGQSTSPFFHVNHASCSFEGIVFDGCTFFPPAATPSAPIFIQVCAANSGRIVISDCYFTKNSNVTTRNYIRCDTANCSGWTIVGNTFGKGGTGTTYIETDGGVSIIGIFIDAAIGPNSPPDFDLSASAASSNVLYIGTGTVSGAGASAVTSIADHGSLTGLLDDDHPGAAWLPGRSGGQTLIGGTAASENLTLQSTSHGTRGKIIIADEPLELSVSRAATFEALAFTAEGTAGAATVGIAGVVILNGTDAASVGQGVRAVVMSGAGQTNTPSFVASFVAEGGAFSGVGVPTAIYGLYIDEHGWLGNTDVVGVEIDAMSADSTNRWGIRQHGTDDLNRLAGRTLIGADADPAAGIGLQLAAGHFRIASALQLQMRDSDDSHMTTFVTGNQAADLNYTLPTAFGAAGTVLTDAAGNGTLSWAAGGAGSGTVLIDADLDTKVDVEESADEDKVKMDVAGTERFLLSNTTPHLTITGDMNLTGDLKFTTNGADILDSAGAIRTTFTTTGGTLTGLWRASDTASGPAFTITGTSTGTTAWQALNINGVTTSAGAGDGITVVNVSPTVTLVGDSNSVAALAGIASCTTASASTGNILRGLSFQVTANIGSGGVSATIAEVSLVRAAAQLGAVSASRPSVFTEVNALTAPAPTIQTASTTAVTTMRGLNIANRNYTNANVTVSNAIGVSVGTTAGARIFDRWGIFIGDQTSGLPSGNTCYGIQIDAFDAASVGTQYVFHYGDVGTPRSYLNREGALTLTQFVTLGNPVMTLTSVATNDDPEEVTTQGRAASTDAATTQTLETFTIPASTTVHIRTYVTARRTGGTAGTAEDGAGYKITAVVKNVAGTATLCTGSPIVTVEAEDVAGYVATIDVTGATARIRVTGILDTNITWHSTTRRYRVGS